MQRMATSAQNAAQSALLRDRILNASRDIVVRDGFPALSMRKIADVIGYSPASLYLHFPSRDAIAQALCAEGHAQLLAALRMGNESADRLKPIAHAYVAYGRTHAQMYRLMFMESPAHAGAAIKSTEPFGDSIRSLFTDALNLHAAPDASARAEALWAALHGIVALSLACPACLHEPLETLVDLTLISFRNTDEKAVRPRVADLPEADDSLAKSITHDPDHRRDPH
jgi:AcrR family transcriptional regulator